jgi:hypothetical protein
MCVCVGELQITEDPCGSWLASEGGVSVTKNAESDGLIAGKPAPTGFAAPWINPQV